MKGRMSDKRLLLEAIAAFALVIAINLWLLFMPSS
jgi:hypothetical protein